VAVGVVVVIVVVLVVVKLTRSTSSGDTEAGRNPAPASAQVVSVITHIPRSTFNAVGTGGQADPFVETADQPRLVAKGLPEVVYIGAEYCPYCALMRWSLVAALGRFGTFTGLKQSSSSYDVPPIPTFSFLGTTYTSKYISFSAYETDDRKDVSLQVPPTKVNKLYTTYDGSGATPTKFTGGPEAGIPFVDIANEDVASGDPYFLASSTSSPPVSALAGGGPGMLGIAQAIADPSSAVGQAIDAKAFIIEANYMTAAICRADGGKPSSVCATSGVKAAEKVIAAAKKIS
jgi:thiol-disulfide isomerase/thioredoxin